MNQIEQTREELKAAVLEYVNTETENITPCAFSVLTGFIDYTYELEKEILRQGKEIEQLRDSRDIYKGERV